MQATHTIQARRVRNPFTAAIPRHWFGGNPLPTHIANGVNLLFPVGERFFVRSVKHYLDRFADDPDTTALIRGFFGQEGNHAREHERFFEIMEAQGYEIRGFLARFERFNSTVMSKLLPPVLRLSATAAAEHFTATLAEAALTEPFLDTAHPVMRDLFLWHAAEEIEHKAVAFDVLQKVNASYWVRIAGLVLAAAALAGWWRAGTRMLLRQDGITRAELRRLRREVRAWRREELGEDAGGPLRDVFMKGIRSYLRRDFHPDDNDNYHLAEAYLARMARIDRSRRREPGVAG